MIQRKKELQSLFEIGINEELYTMDFVVMVHDALNANFIKLVEFQDVGTFKMCILNTNLDWSQHLEFLESINRPVVGLLTIISQV